MSAAARVVSQQRIFVGEGVVSKNESIILVFPEVKLLAFLLLILFSAILFVYIKDLNRRFFVSYQMELANFQQLQVNENKLLLEQSAWSKQSRVQQLAEKRFAMRIPAISDIVVLKRVK